MKAEGQGVVCGDGCRCRCVRALRACVDGKKVRKFLESCGPTGQKFKRKVALCPNKSLAKPKVRHRTPCPCSL